MELVNQNGTPLTGSVIVKSATRAKKCERPTDECAANPCQNNAICVDLHNDYECDCSGTGYTGRHCDVDINECEFTVPACRNNGGGYHCDCIHNFCGKNCTATNVCNERRADLCLNDGECVPTCDEEPYYKCQCNNGWGGENRQSVDNGLELADIDVRYSDNQISSFF